MQISDIKKNLVVSSNDLVYAKYDWTLWQKRLFIYAVSQIERDTKDFKPIKMYIKDIINFYNASDGAMNYKALLEAPKKIDATIEFPYFGEDGIRVAFVKLIQRYTIPRDLKEQNQYIEILFNDDLKPHLLDLKEKFLKYDIRNIIELQSTYSFRLFEILKSYEYKKEIEFNVDVLRDILQLGDLYKSFKDFRKRIIDKAQKDILDYCDISFTYTEKKGVKGKKIEKIVFFISKNKPKKRNEETGKEQKIEPKKTFEIQTKPQETQEQESIYTEFESIVVKDFGVSPFAFMDMVKQYDPERIRKQIRIVQRKKKAGKVENLAGLFMEAVKNDYHDPEEAKEVKKQDRQKRNAEIEILKAELALIETNLTELVNDKIREITGENPEITTRAVAKIQSERTGIQRLKKLGITDPTVEDFRKDMFLRAMVKSAIVEQENDHFREIFAENDSQKNAVQAKIKELSKSV
jgi:plasmid replication initiation protein